MEVGLWFMGFPLMYLLDFLCHCEPELSEGEAISRF
jgi:hypothetical protein